MSFAKNNFAGKITLNDADKNQGDLLFKTEELKKNTKPKYIAKKSKKEILLKT